MAKINLKQLITIKATESVTININNIDITVKQYLPLDEKMELVQRVLNRAVDETGFFSPMRLEVILELEIIRTYTDINITDKMMDAPGKVYDQIENNGIWRGISSTIPWKEYQGLHQAVNDCATAITSYQTSFVGIMKNISENYDATKMNVDELMKTLDQPDKVGMVKEILDKMG